MSYQLIESELPDQLPELNEQAHGFYAAPWFVAIWFQTDWFDSSIDELTEERINPLAHRIIVDNAKRYILLPQGFDWPEPRNPIGRQMRQMLAAGAVIPVDSRISPRPQIPDEFDLVLVGFSASMTYAFYGARNASWGGL